MAASHLLELAPEAVLVLLEGASCIQEGLLIGLELCELRTGVEQQYLLEVGGLGTLRIEDETDFALGDAEAECALREREKAAVELGQET